MRAAVIENDVVINIVETEALDFPGLTLVEAGDAAIGDVWTGAGFSPAATPTKAPAPLSPRPRRFWRLGGGRR